MGELSEALGKGIEREFGGKTWTVEPLDMNDLAELEDWLDEVYPGGRLVSIPTEKGPQQVLLSGIELLDLDKIKHQRQVLWLALRKADPQLGHDDRKNCRYHLTLLDVGRMLSADELSDQSTAVFVTEVLQISGVLPKSDTTEDRNSKKAPRSTSRSRGVSGKSSRSSVSDAATTPTKSDE